MELRFFTLKRVILVAIIVGAGCVQAFAQYRTEEEATIPLEHFYIKRKGISPLRYLLSKLHFSLSTGYGRTNFQHRLDGFGIMQVTDSLPEIFPGTNTASRYVNWTNNVAASSNTAAPAFSVSADTAEIGFRSLTHNIPIKATAHIEFDRYRIGGGYSYDFTMIGAFNPISYKDDITSYRLSRQTIWLRHYFAMAGASVYRYYEYNLVADANVGGYKLGNSFNAGLLRKGIYFNLGATIERDFSEYFRVFVRPSYEFRHYRLAMPEGGLAITHRMNTFYVNLGVTYRLPERPRCFLKTCHAQINHAHGNKEYRSRRHPVYKKQNPHYGENYPTLIKYKGKNKNKLNPY